MISMKQSMALLCILSIALPLSARPKKSIAPAKTSKTAQTTPDSPTETTKTEGTKSRTISIKNTITEEMTTYQFCGDRVPEAFSIEIDGAELPKNHERQLTLNQNEIEVAYNYSFANGLYKGKRSCMITVPESATHTSLAFSWNKQPRLWLEESEPSITI